MNPMSLLPEGLRPEDAIAILTALSAFLVVFAVWRAFLYRDPMASRLKGLSRRRADLRADLMATKRRGGDLRSEHVNIMRRVLDWMNLLRGSGTAGASQRLEHAGLRSREALIVYLFLKIALPIIAGLGAMVFFYGVNPYQLSPAARAGVALVVVALLSYAPDMFLKNAIDKRRLKMTRALPDSLDLLVICAEAGLSLDAALVRVAREIGPACPELADEVGLTSVELGFLPDRGKALQNLARRTGLPAVRGLVNTLMQTEKYGTPLSNSLRVLAAEFRNERMMKAETKAAKLPATLTVPMIIFIMPALFVVLLGPAVLRTIDSLSQLK